MSQLYSEIWQRSALGQSVEQIAADLAPVIDRAIENIEDKARFVRLCLENIERRRRAMQPQPRYVAATEERHRDMEKRYREGESPADIAGSYGVGEATIVHHLKRRGCYLTNAQRRMTRSRYPVPEVAEQQWQWEYKQALLRAYRTGTETYESLGAKIGYSRERVRQLILNAEDREKRASPLERWMANVGYLYELARFR